MIVVPLYVSSLTVAPTWSPPSAMNVRNVVNSFLAASGSFASTMRPPSGVPLAASMTMAESRAQPNAASGAADEVEGLVELVDDRLGGRIRL